MKRIVLKCHGATAYREALLRYVILVGIRWWTWLEVQRGVDHLQHRVLGVDGPAVGDRLVAVEGAVGDHHLGVVRYVHGRAVGGRRAPLALAAGGG